MFLKFHVFFVYRFDRYSMKEDKINTNFKFIDM